MMIYTPFCPAVVVSDLDFADDTAFLSRNHEDSQAILTAVEQKTLFVCLKDQS